MPYQLFKIFIGLVPPIFAEFVKKTTDRHTRASDRGDRIIPCRKSSFGQSVMDE